MKRVGMSIVTAVLALGMLAGCSGGETSNPSSSSQPASRPDSSSTSQTTGSNTGADSKPGSTSSSGSSSASSKPQVSSPWSYQQRYGSEICLTGYQNADGSGLSGDVVIPDKIGEWKVTDISADVFKNNEKITSVTIPGTVSVINNSAFAGCKNLKKVTLQEGVEWIGYRAFAGCTSLSEVDLPSTLYYIENLAFKSCTSLEQIVIPENSKGKETQIKHCAFEDCTGLKKIYLPKTLGTLGPETPFTGFTKIDYIYYGGTKQDWEKINQCISQAQIVLYEKTPADMSTTPSNEELSADNDARDLSDETPNEQVYGFRQDVLKVFNTRRAKAGLKPLRMNLRALNEAAQQRAKDSALNPWSLVKEQKISYSAGGAITGSFAFRALNEMAEDSWNPDYVLNPKYSAIGVGMWDGDWCIIFIG